MTDNNKKPNQQNQKNQEDPENRTIQSYFDDPDKQYKFGRANIIGQLFGDIPEKEIFEEGSAEQLIEKRGAFPNKTFSYVLWAILLAGLALVFYFARSLTVNYVFALIFILYWTAKGYVGKHYVWAIVAAALGIMCFAEAFRSLGGFTLLGICSMAVGVVFFVVVGLFIYSWLRLKKVKAEIELMKEEIRLIKKQEKKEKKLSAKEPRRPVYKKQVSLSSIEKNGEILNIKIDEDEENPELDEYLDIEYIDTGDFEDDSFDDDDENVDNGIDVDNGISEDNGINEDNNSKSDESEDEEVPYAEYGHPFSGDDEISENIEHPFQLESDEDDEDIEDSVPARKSVPRRQDKPVAKVAPVVLSDSDYDEDEDDERLQNLDKPYDIEGSQFSEDDNHPF